MQDLSVVYGVKDYTVNNPYCTYQATIMNGDETIYIKNPFPVHNAYATYSRDNGVTYLFFQQSLSIMKIFKGEVISNGIPIFPVRNPKEFLNFVKGETI